MDKKPFCEVDYDITGVTEFGSSFESLLMGKLQVPPEGFRANVRFAGPITGDIEGTAEGTILVHQTGGKMDTNNVEISDDPLLEEDTKMVLFLRQYDKNNYFVLGGPQGRFIVENDKIYSIGETNRHAEKTTKELHTNGLELSDFLKAIN